MKLMTQPQTAKEVFAMRRRGEFRDALDAARELHKAHPGDAMNVKALGWCLISMAWEEKRAGRPVDHLVEEMRALAIPPDDGLLRDKLDKAMALADPVSKALEDMFKISRSGDHRQAIRLGLAILNEHPGHPRAAEQTAWEVWHILLAELRSDHPDSGAIRRLLHTYRSISEHRRGSVHSRILETAARVACAKPCPFPSFVRFFHWWDPVHLQPEDFNPNEKDGHRYPSTAERIIQALGKTAEYVQDDDGPALETAAGFIEKHMNRYPPEDAFPARKWFPLYLVRTLLAIGNRDKALQYLIPLVRQQGSEFWAWHFLAQCFDRNHPNRLACLCRSVRCRVKGEAFLLNVRVDLAEALVEAGHPNEARHELDRAVATRTENGWHIPPREKEMMQAAWYVDATPVDGSNRYGEWSEPAESLLFSDLPAIDSVIVKTVMVGDPARPHIILAGTFRRGSLSTSLVPARRFPGWNDASPGTPVFVRGEWQDARFMVRSIEKREGRSWDAVPLTHAIVTDRCDDNKSLRIMLSTGESFRVFHDRFPKVEGWLPGQPAQCRVLVDNQGRWWIEDIEPDTVVRTADHWGCYEGPFRPRNKDLGGGGHAGNAFIPEELATEFAEGDPIHGLALRIRERNSMRSWLRAITASRHDQKKPE